LLTSSSSYFEAKSYLKINLCKSFSISFSINPDELYVQALGCQLGAFPFSYLGIPLNMIILNHVDWKSMIDCLDRRLAIWKSSILIACGAFSSYYFFIKVSPLYFMYLYHLTKWDIEKNGRI